MAYMDKGRQILDRVAEEAKELANVEYLPKIEGRNMFMILAPKKTK
jgi:translation initiation factor IF-3